MHTCLVLIISIMNVLFLAPCLSTTCVASPDFFLVAQEEEKSFTDQARYWHQKLVMHKKVTYFPHTSSHVLVPYRISKSPKRDTYCVSSSSVGTSKVQCTGKCMSDIVQNYFYIKKVWEGTCDFYAFLGKLHFFKA